MMNFGGFGGRSRIDGDHVKPLLCQGANQALLDGVLLSGAPPQTRINVSAS